MEIAKEVAHRLISYVVKKDWKAVGRLYAPEKDKQEFVNQCKRIQAKFKTFRVTESGLRQSGGRMVSIGMKAPDGWEPSLEVDTEKRKITELDTNDD